MATSEIDRFLQADLEPKLPPARWEVIVDLGEDHDERWRMITDVIGKVIMEDPDQWPDDGQWERALPAWLVTSMSTDEQADRLLESTPREAWDKLPWHFGSWLDAIKERAWSWSGCLKNGREAQIVLEIVDIPPRIDAFKQILRAAGAETLSEVWI